MGNILGLIMISKMNNYLPIKACNQHKITTASKDLSNLRCHSRPYQKMAHAFGRAYLKLTSNGTVIFRQPSFLL